MTVSDILLRLLSVLLLIAINAFFVTAEFSIVSVRRSRISQLVEAGDLQATTVQSLQRNLDRLLSTTQLGITLASLALGWIGENTLSAIVEQAIAAIPLPLGTSHALAVPLAFFLLVYLQIVLGELCPKSVALIYAEQLARFLGPPIGAIARIFHPFIWILNQSTRWLLQLVGIRPTQWGWHTRVTPEELQLIIETEGESTGLEAGERQLLSNVFEFGDVTAVEVMVPRLRVVAISEGAVLADLLQQIAEVGHSRYPVKGESLDDIIGLIDFKDLALPLAQGQIALDTSIDSWVKPVRFVPESMPLNELLALMQRSHLKLVMVVDEYGSTSGLITLEDVIAEIIGDALPGETGEIPELRVLDEQTFLVQAQMNLEELNELLDLDLPLTEEYQTLGGFLLYQWQKIPAPGESLQYDNLEFTVVSAEGRRLCEVRLHLI
jgi:CBS domain containing-hemolysin-like protein